MMVTRRPFIDDLTEVARVAFGLPGAYRALETPSGYGLGWCVCLSCRLEIWGTQE